MFFHSGVKSENTCCVVFVRADVRCSRSRTVFNRCFVRVLLLLSGTLSETLERRFCVVADLRIHDVASFQYRRGVVFILAAQVGIRPSAPAVLRFISSLLCQWECWGRKDINWVMQAVGGVLLKELTQRHCCFNPMRSEAVAWKPPSWFWPDSSLRLSGTRSACEKRRAGRTLQGERSYRLLRSLQTLLSCVRGNILRTWLLFEPYMQQSRGCKAWRQDISPFEYEWCILWGAGRWCVNMYDDILGSDFWCYG